MYAVSNEPQSSIQKLVVKEKFILESGEILSDMVLAYETFGSFNNTKSNVILICHSLSNNTHVCSADYYYTPAWWDSIVGKGKSINTDQFFIICINNLGGCFGSTGPDSINPKTGRVFGKQFPNISINDIVRSQKLVLDYLGIEFLHTVIGSSMGGLVALEFAIYYPKMVRQLISISSCYRIPPNALALHKTQLELINNCSHAYGNCKNNCGYMLARQISLMSYLHPTHFNQRFSDDYHDINNYLEYNAQKFINHFNKFTYEKYLLAADKYSPDQDKCCSDLQAKTLIVSVNSDLLFPEESQEQLYSKLISMGKEVKLIKHQSKYGHDSFYKDIKIGQYISQFLSGKFQRLNLLVSRNNSKHSILDVVGQTPLVQLQKIQTTNNLNFNLYAKLELLNPGGSIKDRPSSEIIKSAMTKGIIKKDTIIIEYSSGNMGIGLSQTCCYLGLKFICFTDPRCNPENIKIMQCYGTEVRIIEHPDPETKEYLPAAYAAIKSLQKNIPNSFWINQHGNQDNAKAHHKTIQSIYDELFPIDYLFCATSTCGTLQGCGDYITQHKYSAKLIAVDALGSQIFSDKKFKRVIPGHGAGLVPAILNKNLVHAVLFTTPKEAILGAKKLLAEESIFAGGSSGAVLSAILNYRDKIPKNSNCVMIVPDRGERYLNTLYNDSWCEEHLYQT